MVIKYGRETDTFTEHSYQYKALMIKQRKKKSSPNNRTVSKLNSSSVHKLSQGRGERRGRKEGGGGEVVVVFQVIYATTEDRRHCSLELLVFSKLDSADK